MFRSVFLTTMILSLLLASAAQSFDRPSDSFNRALTSLNNHGVELELQFYSDTLTGSPANSSAPHVMGFQFLGVNADLDLHRLTPDLLHTRLYVSVHINGAAGGDFDDACQSMVGITSPAGSRLAELWLERDFGRILRVRAGKIDANPDFAAVSNGAGFLNGSYSYDPTFFPLPNYSNTAWGGELLLSPRGVHVNLAAFDPPQGTGALLLEEAGVDWASGGWNGRAVVGAWQHTGKIPSLSGVNARGARGYYAVGEQKLWRRLRNLGKAEQSLSGFLQLGSAPSLFSVLSRHWGAGLVLSSPFPSRPDDSAGISITRGRLTQEPAVALGHKYETVFETYYSFQLSDWLTISPDLQYVEHPGGAASNRNAVAAGARIVFTLKQKSE